MNDLAFQSEDEVHCIHAVLEARVIVDHRRGLQLPAVARHDERSHVGACRVDLWKNNGGGIGYPGNLKF